jgi:hypothetical protein
MAGATPCSDPLLGRRKAGKLRQRSEARLGKRRLCPAIPKLFPKYGPNVFSEVLSDEAETIPAPAVASCDQMSPSLLLSISLECPLPCSLRFLAFIGVPTFCLSNPIPCCISRRANSIFRTLPCSKRCRILRTSSSP